MYINTDNILNESVNILFIFCYLSLYYFYCLVIFKWLFIEELSMCSVSFFRVLQKQYEQNTLY